MCVYIGLLYMFETEGYHYLRRRIENVKFRLGHSTPWVSTILAIPGDRIHKVALPSSPLQSVIRPATETTAYLSSSDKMPRRPMLPRTWQHMMCWYLQRTIKQKDKPIRNIVFAKHMQLSTLRMFLEVLQYIVTHPRDKIRFWNLGCLCDESRHVTLHCIFPLKWYSFSRIFVLNCAVLDCIIYCDAQDHPPKIMYSSI